MADAYPGQNLDGLPKSTDHRARGLEAIDFEVTTFCHVLEHGADWREVFQPIYWENVAHKLRPGDVIRVHADSHRIKFDLHVQAVNHRISPVYLEFAALPVLPPDLRLPGQTVGDRLRYQVRRQSGTSHRYEIFDSQTGIVPVSGMHRDEALDRAALFELRDQQQPVEPPSRAKA